MFLYLSKLLPLFIYPLGLISLTLVVALIFMKKRPLIARISIILSLLIVLISSNGWIPLYLVRSLEWQHLPPRELPTAEAIIVLGGSTRSAHPPRPTVDLLEQGDRVIYAAQLYRQNKAPLIILSGGRIDWRGSGTSEATDMANILTSIGIPSTALIEEPDSLNTHQNAVNVKKILVERNIKKVLLVTSAMHMPRSLLIFQKQKIDAIPAPTDFLVSEGELAELSATPKAAILSIIPESSNLDKLTRVIKEYIGLAVYRLRGWL